MNRIYEPQNMIFNKSFNLVTEFFWKFVRADSTHYIVECSEDNNVFNLSYWKYELCMYFPLTDPANVK